MVGESLRIFVQGSSTEEERRHISPFFFLLAKWDQPIGTRMTNRHTFVIFFFSGGNFASSVWCLRRRRSSKHFQNNRPFSFPFNLSRELWNTNEMISIYYNSVESAVGAVPAERSQSKSRECVKCVTNFPRVCFVLATLLRIRWAVNNTMVCWAVTYFSVCQLDR